MKKKQKKLDYFTEENERKPAKLCNSKGDTANFFQKDVESKVHSNLLSQQSSPIKNRKTKLQSFDLSLTAVNLLSQLSKIFQERHKTLRKKEAS